MYKIQVLKSYASLKCLQNELDVKYWIMYYELKLLHTRSYAQTAKLMVWNLVKLYFIFVSHKMDTGVSTNTDT